MHQVDHVRVAAPARSSSMRPFPPASFVDLPTDFVNT
jgi:hypothetical protein